MDSVKDLPYPKANCFSYNAEGGSIWENFQRILNEKLKLSSVFALEKAIMQNSILDLEIIKNPQIPPDYDVSTTVISLKKILDLGPNHFTLQDLSDISSPKSKEICQKIREHIQNLVNFLLNPSDAAMAKAKTIYANLLLIDFNRLFPDDKVLFKVSL